MMDQMESESHPNEQLFIQYKDILSRVASFTRLIFYNRKLVNPYSIASHGFKKNISRDGHEEAKCVDCGHSFLLDPIVEEERMETKEHYNQVLNDHEDHCKFHCRGKSKRMMSVNKLTVTEYGVLLFKQILSRNSTNQEILSELGESKQKLLTEQKYHQMIQKLKKKANVSFNVYQISVLGWKSRDKNLIQCQYCGQLQSSSKFDIWEGHRSFCIILQEKCWQPLLYKLMILELQSKQGQFPSTQGAVAAKKLRQELGKIVNKMVEDITQLKYRVVGIRNGIETLDEEGEEGNDKTKMKRIYDSAEQIEKFLKSAIKRVKID